MTEFEFGVFEPMMEEPNEKLPKPKLLLLLLLLWPETLPFALVVFEFKPPIEFELDDC